MEHPLSSSASKSTGTGGTEGAGGAVLQEKGTWSEQVACGDVKPRPLSVLQIRPNNIVMHGGAKKHGL